MKKTVKTLIKRIRVLPLLFPAGLLLPAVCLSLFLTSCGTQGQNRPAAEDSAPFQTTESAGLTDPDSASARSADGNGSASGKTESAGTDWSSEDPAPASDEDPVPVSDSAGLRQTVRTRSEELSEKYAVNILCGDEIRQTYRDYTAAPLPDPEKILEALNTIDRTLSLYPPGYFSSVREGFCDSINICIARDLRAIDGGSYLESAHAFTTVQDNDIWLVLNAQEEVRPSTLIHEITHVTDYRLLGMQQLHESEWNRLNPSGFSYYNAYLDESGNDLRITGSRDHTSLFEEEADQIWFYDPYSKTFAMEDRARLMEKLLESAAGGEPDAMPDRCFESPHIQTKLRFYFYTLRQELGTSHWPDQTTWESILGKWSDPVE